MSIIITIAIFSILVIVHEFGHYISAKHAGVRVEKFGIGFGPALFKIKGKETEFSICLFPLGGFVKLAGDVREDCKGYKFEFFSQPVGVRARIVFWGPLFNFLLAFIIYWMIFYFSGFPAPKPLIGDVVKYDIVAKDKIKAKDLLILKEKGIVEEIGSGQKYITWTPQDLEDKFKNTSFKDNEVKSFMNVWKDSFKITNKRIFKDEQLKKLLEMDLLGEKVVAWNVSSEEELKNKLLDIEDIDIDSLIKVLYGSRYPAYKAGIKEGDLITKINGVKVENWHDMSELIQISKDVINIELIRDEEKIYLDVKPLRVVLKDIDGEREISLIGIKSMTTKSGFINAFVEAGKKTYGLSATILKGLKLLILKKVPFKDAVTGPIGIGVITGKIAKGGILPVLNFMAMLSLSLGIINLFPFPVLDGGHLIFMLIEKVKRSPISHKVENLLTQIAIAALITLMLFVSYNDILRFGVKKIKITPEQLSVLKDKGIVKEIKDNENYVFWRNITEIELNDKLVENGFTDRVEILSIWQNSVKGTDRIK